MRPALLRRADPVLLGSVLALMVLGLYNLASAGQPLGARLHLSHTVHLFLGCTAAVFLATRPRRHHLEALAVPIFVSVIGLLLATMMFGKVVNGSRRWLVLGPLNLQTSDLAKLAVALVLARVLRRAPWGEMSLNDLFRPMNLTRPATLLAAVFALSAFGETLRPTKMEAWARTRFRPALTLRADTGPVVLGRRVRVPEGGRVITVREPGVEPTHATIERTGRGHMLLPGKSGAPLYMNDEPVVEPTLLVHGAVIRLGDHPKAKVRYSDALGRARPLLPFFALFGMVWLGFALRRQWRARGWRRGDFVAPIDVVLVPAGLILVQPDLGTTLVVLLIAFSMILYAGLRPSSLFALIGGSLVAGAFAWRFGLKSYQKERVLTFLDPQGDLAGAGYHQHQSLIAVGSGGWMGKGHGQGTQTQLSFLPEQQTDFIFSVWAEEQGFFGSTLVVLLYAALILSGLRVAQKAADRFDALLAVGVTSMLFWHSITNMLMVLRLAPVVGVPLPLWSNGGSFALTTLIGVGLLLQVSIRRGLD